MWNTLAVSVSMATICGVTEAWNTYYFLIPITSHNEMPAGLAGRGILSKSPVAKRRQTAYRVEYALLVLRIARCGVCVLVFCFGRLSFPCFVTGSCGVNGIDCCPNNSNSNILTPYGGVAALYL